MEYTKENIEKAVCKYFKVEAKDLYQPQKHKYPLGGARDILMYLLYASGYKVYIIQDWFNVSRAIIYRHLGEVNIALKSDTKIKEDIDRINKLLNK
jgi:hypothetical protein